MPTDQRDLIVVLGAGGHAKVVVDAIRAGRLAASVRVRDDDLSLQGTDLLGVTVEAPLGAVEDLPYHVHIAIGSNKVRERLAAALVSADKRLVSVVHPRASVSVAATIGSGAFVAAQAVVAPSALVGECAIINHCAVVDHDCVLGSCVHLAPGATLGGGVRVGSGALIGAGAVVLPGVEIGSWATIGAGAAVVRAVPEGASVIGVPAR